MSPPFAGAPSLPFDTANGAAPPRPAPTDDELDAELAKLDRPRNITRTINAGRGANDDMLHAPQGLHAFFRAYYHYKSADWKGNKPFPLAARTAAELAKIFHLLRDRSGQGDGRDGRGGDAVGGRDCGLQVADRRRGRRLRHRVRQDRFHRRPAGLSVRRGADPKSIAELAIPFPAAPSTCRHASSPARAIGAPTRPRAPRRECRAVPVRRWWAFIWWTGPGTGRSRSSPSK